MPAGVVSSGSFGHRVLGRRWLGQVCSGLEYFDCVSLDPGTVVLNAGVHGGGEIPNFIGITEPYEPPTAAEITLHSDQESVEESGVKIFQTLLDLGYVTAEELKVITGKRMKANPRPAKKARAAEKGVKARPAARAARVAKPAKKPVAKRKGR